MEKNIWIVDNDIAYTKIEKNNQSYIVSIDSNDINLVNKYKWCIGNGYALTGIKSTTSSG